MLQLSSYNKQQMKNSDNGHLYSVVCIFISFLKKRIINPHRTILDHISLLLQNTGPCMLSKFCHLSQSILSWLFLTFRFSSYSLKAFSARFLASICFFQSGMGLPDLSTLSIWSIKFLGSKSPSSTSFSFLSCRNISNKCCQGEYEDWNFVFLYKKHSSYKFW